MGLGRVAEQEDRRKGPIIMADPTTDASQASPKASMTASMVGVPGRSMRLTARTTGGTTRRPTSSVPPRKPKAIAVVVATPKTVSVCPAVRPVTTASITKQ